MKKFILPLLLFILLTPTLLILYVLQNTEIDDLVICATNEESDLIPMKACSYYLMNYRANEKDIQNLENQAGLGFLLNIENKETRNTLIKLFIENGIDINKPSNIDGLPAIQGAILLNDSDLVEILLENNASISQKNTLNGLNAIEFINLLKSKKPSVDRSMVESLVQTKHITSGSR
ncbi:hypothetical protein [Endozoicomonas numazuensis]|uniref:Uncharacterized protein n=1 Tax=Endozoicomonas numazuensis TaxID=1137799 RepID=A0A081NJU0_9GAMM|nr:hypothetical protein [Endozoicomonas numazuensis]KEQ18713.1 hypothetical protein GZ78_00950 [Endozoicomonas numazuensis]